jgi:DNA polymerase elongation subunit (family B)
MELIAVYAIVDLFEHNISYHEAYLVDLARIQLLWVLTQSLPNEQGMAHLFPLDNAALILLVVVLTPIYC